MAIPIILDCDPGHDDAVAILLAVAAPGIDLLGVTTTFGNCSIQDATRNALQVLDLAGAGDVPVGVGAAGPIDGTTVLGNYVHGASGLDGPTLPAPSRQPGAESATELMARLIEGSDEPVTLVPTGPITNVARLLRERPELKERIAQIIFMGGSTERGNHTPYAEFNVFADPEALAECLASGVPIRMVGLNLTHQALATPEVVRRLGSIPGELGPITSAWMGFFGASYHRVWSFAAPPVHDPCTVAALAVPELIEWREAFVAVELDGSWTRGATVVDLDHRLDREPNCSVAITLDAAGYWELVEQSLRTLAR